MPAYMLDTNSVSHLLKSHVQLAQKVRHMPVHALCISAITGGELLFGLARSPDATRLHATVHAFLQHVDVLPWTREVMRSYGTLRACLQERGAVLGPLDMLIAAHALHAQCVLVTNDAAFSQVAGLTGLMVEDWRNFPQSEPAR